MPVDIDFYGLGRKLKIIELIKLVDSNLSEFKINHQNIKNKYISGASTLKSSSANDLSFLENAKYTKYLKKSSAGCIVLSSEASKKINKQIPLIICDYPRRFFALSLNFIYNKNFSPKNKNIIDKTAKIAPGVVFGKGVEISKNVCIGPNTVIGNGVKINQNTIIGSNCSINYSLIGKNCEIYSGARLGTSGFGFDFDKNGVVKFPHLGRVIIGDNVEIGANSTIDRGSLDDTIIQDFVMIDNLVHVAHNVQIGRGSIICGQSGISGSTKLGKNVLVGPQAGFAGHLNIESGSILTARSGVTKSILIPTKMGGFPAVPLNEFKKQQIILKKISKQHKGRKIVKK